MGFHSLLLARGERRTRGPRVAALGLCVVPALVLACSRQLVGGVFLSTGVRADFGIGVLLGMEVLAC